MLTTTEDYSPSWPLKHTFRVTGHTVELIQFKKDELVNIRITSATPDDSPIPFNVMKYVQDEGMATQEFLLANHDKPV